jgi:hypothetical protein
MIKLLSHMMVTVVEKGHLMLRGQIHLTLDSVKAISTLLHHKEIGTTDNRTDISSS